MEKYKVVSLIDTKDKTLPKYRILKNDEAAPAGYKEVFSMASLDECTTWLINESDDEGKWHKLTVFQYYLIAAVTLTFVVVIVIGAFRLAYLPVTDSSQDNTARIFITFSVAVGTIGVAFLAVLTAMLIRDFKERFAQAKEVLTVLVGILGTIVGFYFGSAKPGEGNPPSNNNMPANAAADNSNNNRNGNGNNNGNRNGINNNLNGNSNRANANSNANEVGRAYPYQTADGKWAVGVSKLSR